MTIKTMTLTELEELLRASLRGYIGEADVSALSDYDIQVRILAMLFFGNQRQALYAIDQAFPSRADAEWLDEHRKIRGIPDLGESTAGGTVLVTGTTTALVAEGAGLTHEDGTRFSVDSDTALFTPTWTGKTAVDGSGRQRLLVSPNVTGMAAGDAFSHNGETRVIKEVVAEVDAIDLYVPLSADPLVGAAITAQSGAVVNITASEPGSAGNKPPGDAIAIDSPGSTLDDDAIVLELSGGAEAESVDELRDRVLGWLGARPGAGNVEDYRQWARETPGVRIADAFVYPGLRGANSVDVVPFSVESSRITGAVTNERIADYLAEVAPMNDDVLVVGLTFDGTDVDVTMELEMGEGFEPDWSGSFTTDSGSTATIVKLTADPFGTIEKGDRVLIVSTFASRPKTVVREVASVQRDGFVLTEALPAAPPAGVTVRAAGPSTQAVVDAIESYFADLGPGEFVAPQGVAERWPRPTDAWDFEARRASIIKTVMSVEGVRDMTLTDPSSDAEPAAQTKLRLGTLTITHPVGS